MQIPETILFLCFEFSTLKKKIEKILKKHNSSFKKEASESWNIEYLHIQHTNTIKWYKCT